MCQEASQHHPHHRNLVTAEYFQAWHNLLLESLSVAHQWWYHVDETLTLVKASRISEALDRLHHDIEMVFVRF